MQNTGYEHLEKQGAPQSSKVASPVLYSDDLFQGKREIFILHANQQYRLQITKAGKLILNK